MTAGPAAPTVTDVLGSLAIACGSYRLDGVDGVEASPAALVTMVHESLAEPFVRAVGELARRRDVEEPRWTLGDAWSVRVAQLDRGARVPAGERVWLQAEGVAARVVGGTRPLEARLDAYAGPQAISLVPLGESRRTTVTALAAALAALARSPASEHDAAIVVELATPFDTRGRPFNLASASRAAALTLLRRALDERPDWLPRGEVKGWSEHQADLVEGSFDGTICEASVSEIAPRSRRSTSNAHRYQTAGATGTVRVLGWAGCALGLVCLAVQGGRLRKLGLADVRLKVGDRRFWPPPEGAV